MSLRSHPGTNLLQVQMSTARLETVDVVAAAVDTAPVECAAALAPLVTTVTAVLVLGMSLFRYLNRPPKTNNFSVSTTSRLPRVGAQRLAMENSRPRRRVLPMPAPRKRMASLPTTPLSTRTELLLTSSPPSQRTSPSPTSNTSPSSSRRRLP